MKDSSNLHLKVQELCDCYATNDPLKEMSVVPNDQDKEEAALKWLALAALHGVNNNAKKVTISRSKEGEVTVTAKYREAELPSPGLEVGQNIMDAVRTITHLEKGKTPLAIGIRNDSIELKIKLESKGGMESVTIKFPG